MEWEAGIWELISYLTVLMMGNDLSAAGRPSYVYILLLIIDEAPEFPVKMGR